MPRLLEFQQLGRLFKSLCEGEKVPKVIHFEIPAENTKRAIGFYEKALGWKFNQYGGQEMDYSLVTAGEDKEAGINGAIFKKGESHPATVNTVSVTPSKTQ
jgi:predicted enzyme related to lactoylglutathione lyase